MKFLVLVSTLYIIAVNANLEVMRVIEESQKRLKFRGFFDRSLDRESIFNQPQKCTDGFVTLEGERFACDNINFLSYLSMKDIEITDPPHRESVGIRASDIWGWLSPTNREFTLLTLDNGAAVIDSTDAVNPCIVAKLPTRRIPDRWGDTKVFKNTMYHVKDTGIQDNSPNAPEGNAEYGIEVYDLTQLDQIDCSVEGFVPLNLFPNFVFTGHGRSHNVEVNTQSGRLYSVGSEKCAGGPVILDLNEDPLRPTQIGCLDMDGYTHDLQCLNYDDGPDQDHIGKEICFAFNEDTLTIFDVTDAENVVQISRTLYPNQVYSHQGWTNNDLTKILLDDELDEVCNNDISASGRCAAGNQLSGELRTTTSVFNIVDLDNPVFEQAYVHPEQSIDHNLYVWGHIHRTGQGGNPPMENPPNPNFAYFNNYLAGLKVVDISSDDVSEWTEVGTFDIAPEITEIEFGGAWSGYMHPSGVYAISSIERGLFLLEPEMAFEGSGPGDGGNPGDDGDNGSPGDNGDSSEDDSSDSAGPIVAGIAGFVLLFVIVGGVVFIYNSKLAIFNPKKENVSPNVVNEDNAPPKKNNPMENISTHNPIFQEEA